MPLPRPSTAAIYTRSLSKVAVSPASPNISPPSPLRPTSTPDATAPNAAGWAQLRRSKKAAELASKPAKAKRVYSWSTKVTPRTSVDLTYDDDKVHEDAQEQDSEEAPSALGPGNKLEERARPDLRSQVQLADLVITKKPRRKAKDGDFEVIPPVRSVIVLDEATPDLDFDEPWEHIYADEMKTYEPSYAKIVSLN